MLCCICFITVIVKEQLCFGTSFVWLRNVYHFSSQSCTKRLFIIYCTCGLNLNLHVIQALNPTSSWLWTKTMMVVVAASSRIGHCATVLWDTQMEFLRWVPCDCGLTSAQCLLDLLTRLLRVLLSYLGGWWHLKNKRMQSFCPVELW